jgi:hydrogenase maturation factor
MSGISIAARYAFTPNSLGYCGTSSFSSLFHSGEDGLVMQELEKFHPHYAYLSLIARENSMRPFDEEVVRAFWTGNSLLDNVSSDSLRLFIKEELFPKGHPRAEQLSSAMPEGLVPHHSFNSLYVNFVTDKVEKSISSFDSCCVLPARVLSVSGNELLVERHMISEGPSVETKQDKILLEFNGVRFIDSVTEGELLSVHWGMAIEKLSQEQADNIIRYTKRNADVLRQRNRVPSA